LTLCQITIDLTRHANLTLWRSLCAWSTSWRVIRGSVTPPSSLLARDRASAPKKTSLVFCSKTFCVVRQSVTRCWPQLLATRTARLVPLASLIAGAWSSAARRSSPGAGLGRSQLGHPGLSSRGPATLVCRLVWSQAARRSSPEPYVSEAARSNKLAPCVCTVLPRLVASGSPELTRTLRRAPLSR